jgi:thioredoxin 2
MSGPPQNSSRYRFLKVNTEEEPALATRYNIRSIPTMMLFMDGQPVAQTAGAMDTSRIMLWVETHTPTR